MSLRTLHMSPLHVRGKLHLLVQKMYFVKQVHIIFFHFYISVEIHFIPKSWIKLFNKNVIDQTCLFQKHDFGKLFFETLLFRYVFRCVSSIFQLPRDIEGGVWINDSREFEFHPVRHWQPVGGGIHCLYYLPAMVIGWTPAPFLCQQ